jgi:hypothetical protein
VQDHVRVDRLLTVLADAAPFGEIVVGMADQLRHPVTIGETPLRVLWYTLFMDTMTINCRDCGNPCELEQATIAILGGYRCPPCAPNASADAVRLSQLHAVAVNAGLRERISIEAGR